MVSPMLKQRITGTLSWIIKSFVEVKFIKRLLLVLPLLLPGAVRASYVTQNFASVGLGTNNIQVAFVPTATPILLTNGQVVYSSIVKTNAPGGILYPVWVSVGPYNVTFGPQNDVWQINVPYDSNTYSLYQLATNVTTVTNIAQIPGSTNYFYSSTTNISIVTSNLNYNYTNLYSYTTNIVNNTTNYNTINYIIGTNIFSTNALFGYITNNGVVIPIIQDTNTGLYHQMADYNDNGVMTLQLGDQGFVAPILSPISPPNSLWRFWAINNVPTPQIIDTNTGLFHSIMVYNDGGVLTLQLSDQGY